MREDTDSPPANCLKNFDLVGGCYDVLHVDPININADGATKLHMAFAWESFEKTKDGQFSIPVGTTFAPAYGGETDTVVTKASSAYDFQTYVKQAGSLSLSDATGQLFCATLSGSFQQLRGATKNRESVATYASYLVSQYRLEIDFDSMYLALSDEIADAFAALPETEGDGYQELISKFGTHYMSGCLFGGLATQHISLSNQDYTTLLQEGVDIEFNATATFELFKSKDSASRQDKRDQKFTTAKSLKVGKVKFVGGQYTQEFIDMWAMTVPDEPMPVRAAFRPLYDLLSPEFCPETDEQTLITKQDLLRRATESYLGRTGVDVRGSVLRCHDQVTLQLQATGPTRALLSKSSDHVRTIRSANVQDPSDITWTLIDPNSPDSTAPLAAGQRIRLRSPNGGFLDAQSGTERDKYWEGDGLAGITSSIRDHATVEWTPVFPDGDATRRSDVVSGDLISLKASWRPLEGNPGYLLGEADPNDLVQRVYGFGSANQAGTFWVISRSSD